MAARFLGETDTTPPTEAQLQQVEAAERAILSGELLRRVIRGHPSEHDGRAGKDEAGAPEPHDAVQISGTPETDEPNHRTGTSETNPNPTLDPTAQNDPVQISVTPAAKVTLRIRVPGDLLLHYRQLERLHRQKLPGESFIQFLCTTFWQTWVPHLGVSDKWESIYRRDRYRCTNPVCHQRNVTLHHVNYRANGGTDHPTWLLGRHPIIRVHRRERTLLD